MNKFLIFIFTITISGCSGSLVKSFNNGSYIDSELVKIEASQGEGVFGHEIIFTKLNGKGTYRYLEERAPTTIKVIPGKHSIKIHYTKPGLYLNQSLNKFQFEFKLDAIKGHEYKINIDVDKSLAQQFSIGGKLSAWIEDVTTGDKLVLVKQIPNN